MVLKKRQYYGFNGFNFPFVPRAPRSTRGRVVHKKKVEDSQLCPFELLASLAGKLLQESESSSASSNASEAPNHPAISDGVIKLEQFEDKPAKTECLDQASCEGSTFVNEIVSPDGDRKCLLKESPLAGNNSALEHSSMLTNSDSSVKVSSPIKSVICKGKSTTESFSGKVEGGLPDSGDSCEGSLENGLGRQPGEGVLESGGLTVNNTCSSNAPLEPFVKFPAMTNSGNHVELPFCRDAVPNSSVLGHRNNVKLGIRDDDENFSMCNKLNIKPKAFRPPPRIGDRRIRKLLTSKYWKLAPKLKDCELPKVGFPDGGAKPLYRKRKICYSRDRYQHKTLYKRRKFSDPSLVVTSDGGFSSESVCNSPEKGMMRAKNGSTAISHGANGVSSSLMGHQASFHPKGSHVKFSIKSFKIPELFIEVPENATVGSLKRTVMEAVTAILGDGLRVGVLLHGKKVRDDNRTLVQTGITSVENLDTLGFTLEPTPAQAPAAVCTEDPPALLPCNQSQTVSRSPATPISDPGTVDALPDLPPLADLSNNNNIESNHESVSTPTDMLTDNSHSDSKALVPVLAPPVNAEALAVVPVNQKSRRPELVQRRTRRPFSVAEVEALVQAVEELGTGRWRDVKLRSFENADHRTYVDLKDKWKTLVHTAKIAPQQRRGEPVPQDLLDRVLAAHAYWSQHQAKQHGKNQTVALKVAETQASRSEGYPLICGVKTQ